MQLIRNPLTYLLGGFALLVYVPFIFAGLLLFLSLDLALVDERALSIIVLAFLFFMIFVLAGIYVQSLLFAYAQKGARARLLEVFSGARKQFFRILLLDAIIFSLLIPPAVLWLLTPNAWALVVLVMWSLVLGVLFLSTPRFIHKYTTLTSINKSMKSVRDARVYRAAAILAVATAVVYVFSVPYLDGFVFSQHLMFFASSGALTLLGVTAFFPSLFATGLYGSPAVLIAQRVLAVLFLIWILHTVCAKK